MKLNLLLILSAILILCCCKSEETYNKCLESYVKGLSANPEYKQIRSAANDTVKSWATNNVKFFSSLNSNFWKIDSAVVFNEDKSKAVLLVLEIDSNSTATFDHVKMLAAEKKEGSWHFYFQSMPTIGFDRTLNRYSKIKRPYTFKELSMITRMEIASGGYFKDRSCHINYNYVNDWFKVPLAEYHQDFLRNKAD